MEEKRVKWIIAMYNKKGKQSFDNNDVIPAKIFAKSLNSLISSVLVTSNINEQMRDSSSDIKDMKKTHLLHFEGQRHQQLRQDIKRCYKAPGEANFLR